MKSFSLACDICGTVNPMSRTHCLACGQVLAASNASDSLALSPTASALSSTLLKQRYRVMHIIGKGGMGTVYIGIDTLLGNRLVAIKVLTPGMSATSMVSRSPPTSVHARPVTCPTLFSFSAMPKL